MFVPDILTAPLRRTDDRTSDYPLLDDGQVQVGIWECAAGTAGDPGGDYDETMYMVAGRLSVAHPEGVYDVAPGTLWATPRHWGSEWQVHQTVRKLYVIDQRPGAPGVAAHLPNAHTAPLGAPAPRPVVLAGDPHEATATLWAHNRLETGTWECTPGEFPFRRDGYDEVFCVLSGHATIQIDGTDGPGQSFDLRPGSVLLTPAGLTGRWLVHETIRKAYTIVHR
ncbi:MAG: DUF861 domain-containing protein [Ilumatobacteraceae bacterium]|mgnify:FL=1|nr:DUF861 domain-containing protein [Ilumatobacteraceae bacterium]